MDPGYVLKSRRSTATPKYSSRTDCRKVDNSQPAITKQMLTLSLAQETAAGSCVSSESIDLIEASPNTTSCDETSPPGTKLSSNYISRSLGSKSLDPTSELSAIPDAVKNVSSNISSMSLNDSENPSIDIRSPMSLSIDMFDDDLPATQPVSAFLLNSIVAYVEVRTGGDNRSRSVKDQLSKLGATVVDKFTRNVTHVVFKEGKLSTYQRAIKNKVHLVSNMWIEQCKMSMTRVPEKLYPPYNMEEYESPHPFKKIKRVKSYQPDYGNEREERFKRMRKKRKPRNIENHSMISAPDENTKFECKPTVNRPTKPRGPCDELSRDNGLVRALYTLAGKIDFKYDEYVRRPASPNSSDEDREPTPLAVRLLRKIISPQVSGSVVSSHAVGTYRNHENVAVMETDIADNKESNSALNMISPLSSTCVTPRNGINKQVTNEVTPCERTIIDTSTPIATNEAGLAVARSLASVLPKSPIFGTARTLQRRLSMRQQLLSSTQSDKTTRPTRQLFSKHKIDMKTSSQLSNLKYNVPKEDLNQTTTSCTSDMSSTQKKRRLFNIVRHDDSPKLVPINENSVDENNANCCVSGNNFQLPVKSTKTRCSIDMDLTNCVPTSDVILVNSLKNSSIHPFKGTFKESSSRSQYDCSSTKQQCVSENQVPLVPRSRRSSIYFKKLNPPKNKSNLEAIPKSLPTLVCTSLHKEEVEEITAAVESLGGFAVEEKVTSRTTHVVCDELVRRTLNVLKGITRGCWIVKRGWVLNSLQTGKWLDEEKYEATEFSPSVQQCRLEKLSFGPAYRLKFFNSCGPMYVSRSSDPPYKDLIELISLCGGRVVNGARAAQIVVGDIVRDPSIKCVNVKWVLDSVTAATLKPIDDYIIQKQRGK